MRLALSDHSGEVVVMEGFIKKDRIDNIFESLREGFKDEDNISCNDINPLDPTSMDQFLIEKFKTGKIDRINCEEMNDYTTNNLTILREGDKIHLWSDSDVEDDYFEPANWEDFDQAFKMYVDSGKTWIKTDDGHTPLLTVSFLKKLDLAEKKNLKDPSLKDVIADHSGNSIVFEGIINNANIDKIFDKVRKNLEDAEVEDIECGGKSVPFEKFETLRIKGKRKQFKCRIDDLSVYSISMRKKRGGTLFEVIYDPNNFDILDDISLDDLDYGIFRDNIEGEISIKRMGREEALDMDQITKIGNLIREREKEGDMTFKEKGRS